MAKKKTLEDVNALVETLAQQYRDATQALDDALLAMGQDQESRDRVVAATAEKQRLWAAYSKAKKQQFKMKNP